MLTTVISFIVLLLVLIFVHELGHFMAAKIIGVKVERFSLGFPPKAWSRQIGETEYQLAWLPLGGYVKMYGEDPSESGETPPELRRRSFAHQPPWARMIIVLAGPAFNLVFAALLFWGLIWVVGIQHLAPVIGPVKPGSPAAEAGLQMDDLIVKVNGRPALYFDALDSALAEGRGAPLDLTVSRQGRESSYRLTPARRETQNLFGDPLTIYDVGLDNRMPSVIAKVHPGKPADKAGLAAGDEILAINGRPTPDWQDVLSIIQGPPEARASVTPKTVRPLYFEVRREGKILNLEMIPELVTGLNASGDTTYTPMVGMETRARIVTEPVGFIRAAGLGFLEAANMIKLTLVSVQKLVTGQVSAKTLGGPLLIAEVTGDKARAGLTPLLNLAAFISINLGILNLLPIPVLDGGQLLFFIVEAVRRKPLSLRFREGAQWVGLVFIGLLMVVVFYNDIARLVARLSTKTEIEAPAESAPAPASAPDGAGGSRP
ncbi:MAG: RIP metalloprotease RseP [Candidatus Adiutrix sp.]|jgi:regulator of sigma E protease|nr:RIP metalloprotease RseP [Candidatus Adiutrix sp.]